LNVTCSRTPPEGPSFFLSRTALRALGLAHRDAYASAAPFPHVVIDDFLGAELASHLARVFPDASHPDWKRRDHEEQAARLGQLQRTAFEGVDGALRHLLNELSGMSFLKFLETLTGIQGLIPDAHFRGAGLHLTLSGGHLALHADFNRDRFRHLTRKLSVLYYLNPDWQSAWGGDLELWNADLSRCEASIAPMLDRLVVMAHGDTFWHGHPSPLRCPEDRGRCAVAAYFYVAEPDADAPKPHSALWAPPRG
jgi:Rps23 Pro-64 3,4-dihydroxylase Tpa1-like proline 4-hydroxylase